MVTQRLKFNPAMVVLPVLKVEGILCTANGEKIVLVFPPDEDIPNQVVIAAVQLYNRQLDRWVGFEEWQSLQFAVEIRRGLTHMQWPHKLDELYRAILTNQSAPEPRYPIGYEYDKHFNVWRAKYLEKE